MSTLKKDSPRHGEPQRGKIVTNEGTPSLGKTGDRPFQVGLLLSKMNTAGPLPRVPLFNHPATSLSILFFKKKICPALAGGASLHLSSCTIFAMISRTYHTAARTVTTLAGVGLAFIFTKNAAPSRRDCRLGRRAYCNVLTLKSQQLFVLFFCFFSSACAER